uniref:Uncharacterized protein n=2 Tax=Knipowitschia caucasica TaxID=637954 RepID=A0AAV2KBU3_KNICA
MVDADWLFGLRSKATRLESVLIQCTVNLLQSSVMSARAEAPPLPVAPVAPPLPVAPPCGPSRCVGQRGSLSAGQPPICQSAAAAARPTSDSDANVQRLALIGWMCSGAGGGGGRVMDEAELATLIHHS